MAYDDLGAISSGDPGASDWANQVRANFQAGIPDIFTAKGDIAAATGADAAARLAVGADDSILVPDSGEATGLAWQIQPACRVYRTTDYDPATGTWVSIPFGSERFDLGGMHDTGSDTERITIPTGGDGIYLIGACIELGTAATVEEAGLRILLNGSTPIVRSYDDVDSGTSRGVGFCVTTLYSLSAADYLTAQVYTHADVDVIASGNQSPEFWAIWQRRA